MRIIGGKYRGRRLKSPPDGGVRPTSDRVREAVFNILRQEIPDAAVLDLFAGTGAMGLEAISRGAARAVLCDRDTSLAKANLAALGAEAELYCLDYRDALNRLSQGGEKFDVIFLDPPYREALAERALEGIAALGLLREGGVAVLEHPAGLVPEGSGLTACDTRRYGKSGITLYRREA